MEFWLHITEILRSTNTVRYTAQQRKKDQSLIVFNEIVKFIRSDHDLDECFNVHEHNSTIDCLLTHSKIKALSGDTKSIDGFRRILELSMNTMHTKTTRCTNFWKAESRR